MPFFVLLEESYDLTLFVKAESRFDRLFKNIYVSKKNIVKTGIVQRIPLSDLFLMIRSVKNSDIVVSSFANDFYTIVLKLLTVVFRKKIVTWEEGRDTPDSFIQRIKWIIYKWCIKRSDAIFTLGEVHKKTFERIGVNPIKIFVSNEYPATNYGKLEGKPIVLPGETGNKTILYLGRILEVKGIIYLINSFKALIKERNDFNLLIIGDGPEKKGLMDLVEREKIANVNFMAGIYDDGIKSFIFKNSYIGIVPSIKLDNGTSEGGPLVVLEYLSTGLPIIGSDRLGSSNKYIISGLSGLIVAEKDSIGIRNAILQLDTEIQNGIISRVKIKDYFSQIPDHTGQVRVLKSAINFVNKEH
jgi:glycosyltransferase involved in cell wall biosynthesis